MNLYGPGDNFNPQARYVIPALIKKCFDAMDQGRDYIEVWGIAQATREFFYLKDAAKALALASELYGKSDPVNLSGDMEIYINDLVELIARPSGFHGEIREDPSKPDGQLRRRLDVERAKEEFGFEAHMCNTK